jgi:alkaline phosphatase/alkaline phosphatase D
VAPGSKNGTDPDARVRQPYTYPKPTGGFLHVRLGGGTGDAATLVIEHRDDTGKVMNTVTKRAGTLK